MPADRARAMGQEKEAELEWPEAKTMSAPPAAGCRRMLTSGPALVAVQLTVVVLPVTSVAAAAGAVMLIEPTPLRHGHEPPTAAVAPWIRHCEQARHDPLVLQNSVAAHSAWSVHEPARRSLGAAEAAAAAAMVSAGLRPTGVISEGALGRGGVSNGSMLWWADALEIGPAYVDGSRVWVDEGGEEGQEEEGHGEGKARGGSHGEASWCGLGAAARLPSDPSFKGVGGKGG